MDFLPICAEPITLSQAHIRALEARPDPAHEIEPVVECELQHSHPGSHLALGQSYGDATELWLRWQSGQPAEFLDVGEPGYCTAEGPDRRNRVSSWNATCLPGTQAPIPSSCNRGRPAAASPPRRASAGWKKLSGRP